MRALRIAFIGNSLPRRCGIATFTSDLELAVRALPDVAETAIIAMTDPGSAHAYPAQVRRRIREDRPADYLAAASFINDEGFDVVSLQHEFGIFGGEAGSHILELIAGLRVPLVTTFHTVLDRPTAPQRRVMEAILAASSRVVVMARKGRDILVETYGADPEQIVVIPHGIPDVPFAGPAAAKARLGYEGRKVVLTFGLIGPSKGIELMIEAMPAIVERTPEAVYVVMGATHPQLLREAGEAYRESLVARVEKLGLTGHVVFLNRFADRPELLEHIAMCDVYVTPYLNVAQMTSGTLAYSHGLGRPVVSTPYWHAGELLADGSGMLVPFGDPLSLGEAVGALLENEPVRLAMAQKAYTASRPMTWARSAKHYVEVLRDVTRREPLRVIGGREMVQPVPRRPSFLPEPSTLHFEAMCDDTGLFQHAVHSVPDRHHGYCIDDNARALLLCCTPLSGFEPARAQQLAGRFAAFVQHGWNPDNKRFRNFMGFGREWLEPLGSEDSHGRTLWALGTCAKDRSDLARARWAADLFCAALPTVAEFTSPRAWAFTLLGLDHFCAAHPERTDTALIRGTLARRLEICLLTAEEPGRVWFEERLTYDNARLCEALIRTGRAMGEAHLTDAGLRSLRWLIGMQTAPAGHFRPVGSEGFMLSRQAPLAFDQQPIEAAATIAACAAAHAIQPGGGWHAEAACAFAWFLGDNDLAIPLVDITTGSCRDGLHPDRANENRGAESVLSYLLGLADMRGFEAGFELGSGAGSVPRLIVPATRGLG